MSSDVPPGLQTGKQAFASGTTIISVDVLWEETEGCVFITPDTAELLEAAGVDFEVLRGDNEHNLLLVCDVLYNGCMIDAVARKCGARIIDNPS